MDFKFPDVGEGITEGVIVKWHVKKGDKVKADQVLAEIETDKAIVDIPSPKAGTISKINHKKGDTIKVGEVLVVIDEGSGKKPEPSSKKSSSKKASKKKKSEKTPKKKSKKTKKKKSSKKSKPVKKYTGSVVGHLDENVREMPSATSKKTTEKSVQRIRATPHVRRLAREQGVDISAIKGTGHEGRITEEDVKRAKKRPVVAHGKSQELKLKGMRKAIAKNMVESHTTTVTVTNMYDCDVTGLWDVRKKEKVKAEKKGVKLTFLPYIIEAVVEALKKNPMINASLDHETILLKKYYNIGVAVDTEDGLVVPVVKNADKKSLIDIAKELIELSEKARARKLSLKEMQEGSFTITNLGSIGVKYFTPIINYPESAILGLGRIEDKFNGKEMRKSLPLSFSYDHRIIDGATASRFMLDVMKKLESYK